MAREKTARRSVTPQFSSFCLTGAGGSSTTRAAKLCADDSAIGRLRFLHMLDTLLQPAKDIFSQKQQHANLLISPGEHSPEQYGFFLRRSDHPLQCQRRKRSLQKIVGPGAATERVQDQRRQLNGLSH